MSQQPRGIWKQEPMFRLDRWLLRAGPIEVVVEKGYRQVGWMTRVASGRDIFTRREREKVMLFKTREEAMVCAETRLGELIAEAVREGSRLGLYGRGRVLRSIREQRAAVRETKAEKKLWRRLYSSSRLEG